MWGKDVSVGGWARTSFSRIFCKCSTWRFRRESFAIATPTAVDHHRPDKSTIRWGHTSALFRGERHMKFFERKSSYLTCGVAPGSVKAWVGLQRRPAFSGVRE